MAQAVVEFSSDFHLESHLIFFINMLIGYVLKEHAPFPLVIQVGDMVSAPEVPRDHTLPWKKKLKKT